MYIISNINVTNKACKKHMIKRYFLEKKAYLAQKTKIWPYIYQYSYVFLACL